MLLSPNVAEGAAVIILDNDDGKKMVERDGLDSFLEEYAYVTGVKLTLIAAGERPDFAAEKRGRRYGLEVVRACGIRSIAAGTSSLAGTITCMVSTPRYSCKRLFTGRRRNGRPPAGSSPDLRFL
jgi:hypothetical protein